MQREIPGASKEGLILVWFDTIVCFQGKSVCPLGKNLLFSVHVA
jgi:hypothetical protein